MPSLVYSLLHFFLKRVISDGKASICGRANTVFGLPITLTLQIADEKHELEALDESLDKICTRYRKYVQRRPN